MNVEKKVKRMRRKWLLKEKRREKIRGVKGRGKVWTRKGKEEGRERKGKIRGGGKRWKKMEERNGDIIDWERGGRGNERRKGKNKE